MGKRKQQGIFAITQQSLAYLNDHELHQISGADNIAW